MGIANGLRDASFARMSISMSEFMGAILAGGKSSRMGEDKASLLIEEKTLLDYIQQLLRSSDIDNIYISNSDNISDIIPLCGPLSGVHAILKNTAPCYEYILFIPIDMPMLNPSLIKKLTHAAGSASLITFKNHKMPFLLKNEEKTLELAEQILKKQEDFSLGSFFANINNKQQIEISASEQACFENINTKKQWAAFINREYS